VSPELLILPADAVLAMHAGFIAFVVVGQAAILVGIALRWRWVRGLWFRVLHLGAIGFVVLIALTAAAIGAERIEYYVWTDEQGVAHASDTRPQGVEEYEIRTLDADENVVAAPEPETGDSISRSPDAADRGESGRASAGATQDGLSGAGKAILLDEALQQSEPLGNSVAQERELQEQRLLERGQAAGAAAPPRGTAPGQGPAAPGGPSSPPGPASPTPPSLPSF